MAFSGIPMAAKNLTRLLSPFRHFNGKRKVWGIKGHSKISTEGSDRKEQCRVVSLVFTVLG